MAWSHAAEVTDDSYVTPVGLAAPGQTGTLTNHDSGVAAVIYSDRDRSLTLNTAGQVKLDGTGNLSGVFTEPGRYRLSIGTSLIDVTVNPDPDDLAALGGNPFATITAWAPSTSYAAGQLVTFSGSTYSAKTSFTSGATFNAANWNLIAAGGSASITYSGTTPPATTTGASVVGTDTSGPPHPDHAHTLGAHASTHNSGGSDAVTLAQSQVTGLAASLAALLPLAGGTLTGALTGTTATWSGASTASAFSVTGLTGAATASRYVGATASGAPTTGTFLTNDWVLDVSGPTIRVCTAGGSPGTWTQLVASTGAVIDGGSA